MTKRWVQKTDLLKVRPAKAGEMVEAGQFAQDGDMVIVRIWPDDNFLIAKRNLGNYIEVEVPDDKGVNEVTAEEKNIKITNELNGIDPSDMTTAELKIRDIVTGLKASVLEKEQAIGNTNDICG